jgi:Mrp family chromosome partitioning ATPase
MSSIQTGGSQVIQKASGPGQKVDSGETRNLIIAGILGALIGLALAFLRDRLDPRLKTESAVRAAARGVPILATVPHTGRRRRWVAAEGFYTLRAAMDALNGNGRMRSVLVTGSMSGEGKSTTTVNLAAAMSAADRGVTVLEADLRRPGLSRSFGLNGGPGMTSVLSGHSPMESVLARATVSPDKKRRGPALFVRGEFRFLPAGLLPDAPAAVMNDAALGGLLERAIEGSDTVIVDGPPLGMFGDMLPVARRVEGVILAVRLYHTKRDGLARLLDRLAAAGVQPVGIVVLGTGESSDYASYAGRS